jgi:hypothetical protein
MVSYIKKCLGIHYVITYAKRMYIFKLKVHLNSTTHTIKHIYIEESNSRKLITNKMELPSASLVEK